MQILKNLNLYKKVIVAVVALIAGITIAGKIYLKSDTVADLPEPEGEVIGTESQSTDTPTPTEEPTAITKKEKQTAPSGTPTSTNTPTPKQESTYQSSTNTPTPYPTSGNIQGSDTSYEQEFITDFWADYYKQKNECLAERNALIQPLRDQINQKYDEYNSIPEKVTQALSGQGVNASQINAKIAYEQANSSLLDEIADLESQIFVIEGQYPCY